MVDRDLLVFYVKSMTSCHMPKGRVWEVFYGVAIWKYFSAMIVGNEKCPEHIGGFMVNTSSEASKRLEQALATSREAASIIDNLIAEHEYQDVALLVTQAAGKLLEAAAALMQSNDEAGLGALESADDLLDAVYDIIDGETDED